MKSIKFPKFRIIHQFNNFKKKTFALLIHLSWWMMVCNRVLMMILHLRL